MHKGFVDKTVVELARERVAEIFNRFDRVSVSFSGGKDSTVCLMLCLEEARKRGKLPLEVVFWDEEAIHPETIDYVKRVFDSPEISMRWICAPVKHRNACSRKQPWWHPWNPDEKALWCRDMPAWATREDALPGFRREMIPELTDCLYPNDGRTVGHVMGIRAAESLRRFRSVTNRSVDNWLSWRDHAKWVAICKPIYDWTTEDVWTAPEQFGWDYNRTYDIMRAMGISPAVQRVAPPYGEEPFQNLWMWAQGWPHLWEKMLKRVHGAATAARYSRSPLYGFGHAQKPEGMSWQDAIKHAIQKWGPRERREVSARIAQEIDRWNEMTGFSPLPETSHDSTSWQMLYTIAVRGDFKKRKGKALNPENIKPAKAGDCGRPVRGSHCALRAGHVGRCRPPVATGKGT